MCNKENTTFEEYFFKVESYFALKRDRAVLLSPEEFEVVEYFYNEGVPLKIIFKGIDRFYEKKKKSKRKTKRIYFLTHVKDHIEEVWQDYKRKGTGSYLVSGESEKDFIVNRIDEIIDALNKAHKSVKSVCQEVTNRLVNLKDKVEELTLEDAEGEMESIFEFATEKIFDILNSELKWLKEEVEIEVNSLVESIGKEISPDVIDRFKKQIVFEKLKFPNISLFG
ncbi:hypothetical protein TTHT_0134 [Thermotomaculum hydrothermale]|uniref:Uncharacterized protein n=1 Tax=Thermotomaculum hydrothermale TaxID=981385 RepID=A0A7R6PKE8_9BACT|nr:hypothetical protein [Thermotomaculum hydrothermale]BBB31777.1 hypothetical protein TTHT_0134 [Thermotomaculum hydrothermale]